MKVCDKRMNLTPKHYIVVYYILRQDFTLESYHKGFILSFATAVGKLQVE